ncbi:MAG: alpha/beta hydrolase-fold protein [Allobranchiibius sp.]
MFEPDGTVLVWMLWLMAFAGLITAALLWPRLAVRSPMAFLGRFGMQLAASALVVLAVAGTLNQQNGWYGSWADLSNDLTGSAPTIGPQALHGDLNGLHRYNARAAALANRQAQRQFGAPRAVFQQSVHLRGGPAPLGHYVQVRVPGLGPAAGRSAGKVLVWLPPTYADGSQQQTYPVIEAFGGIPGSPQDYSKRMNLQKIIVQAHQTAGLVEPVVVIPDYTPGGLDTECVNAPGVAMETWLNTTIPAWVTRHLRVRPGASSWATMGFSAGGFCAEVSAFLHPQQFGTALLFGTYNKPIWGDWHPFGKNSATPARYDILSVALRRPPPIDVWVEDSESDRFSAPQVRRLVAVVHQPTSLTTVKLIGAGHRFSVWQAAMPGALAWLARSEPGFQANVPGSAQA